MKNRLDGLEAVRGLAAILVVIHHAGAIAEHPDALSAVMHKAYLAVDLFFLLSGYVLARTYEHRMPPAVSFFVARYRRLWLPIAAGVVIGAGLFLALGTTLADLLPYLVTGLAILPVIGFAISLNPPAWSIFFELFANFAHALLFKRVSSAGLLVIIVACAGLLLLTLSPRALDVGFDEWFWQGFPRVLMSYLLGIVLWRVWGDRPIGGTRLGWFVTLMYVPTIALVPILLSPAVEVPFVLVAGPFILLTALGIGNSPVARALGALSFPLYALHFPLQMMGAAAGLEWQANIMFSVLGSAAVGLLVDRRWRAIVGALRPAPRQSLAA